MVIRRSDTDLGNTRQWEETQRKEREPSDLQNWPPGDSRR